MNYYAESTWKNYDPEQQADIRIAKLVSLFPENMHYYKYTNCGLTYNAYGHLQSFSKNTLNSLLTLEFSFTAQDILCPLNRDFIPFLLDIKQHWLKQWFNPPSGTIDSNCGKSEFLNKKSLFTKSINYFINMSTKPQPYWFMELFVWREN
ncbi:MAG TPA: hypothetical protein PLI24_04160 [Candidatus Cloacimonas sp.]|jgi:hypothetical protein|nr:hypothetical protein [Candidatus Cloacimonadota bacterium]HNV92619.1 hypothetical protein [Candidatus Cloacimonas sp.]MDD3734328.1 hypothetical protein [Candidatus Cloacimonadota bacterium]MDD3870406.1 hypothetical protein [Candidatus Cloacimonadota bacterium]MDD4677181.1 hypothetical protein [Candidatus Cloacimonadota bacterium]